MHENYLCSKAAPLSDSTEGSVAGSGTGVEHAAAKSFSSEVILDDPPVDSL
jgi:hypothetical protein